MTFSKQFRRHFSLRLSVVTATCADLRSPYPAGNRSIAILRSIPPNSRRDR
jgi:hypothetical protein